MPVPTVPGRWLRHKRDRTVYAYSELLAQNPSVEEVSEEEAFPERFIPEAQRGRVSKITLDGPDAPAAPPPAKPELAQEVATDIEKKSERAHAPDGKFQADDPETRDVNEAFVADKAPGKPRKKAAKKPREKAARK